MDVIVRRIPFKFNRRDSFRLYTLADIHYGAKASSKQALVSSVQKIKNTHRSYWYGGGDFFDSISVNDKRFDMRMEKALDKELWDLAEHDISQYNTVIVNDLLERLWPIMPQCLGLASGNHDDNPAKRGQYDLLAAFITAYKLKCLHTKTKPNPWVERTSQNTVIILKTKRGVSKQDVFIFAVHGAGNAISLGGRLNKLSSVIPWMPQAHLYVAFHYHESAAAPKVKLRVIQGNNGTAEIVTDVAKVMLAPSMYETYRQGEDNYASLRLYAPSVVGIGEVDVYPFANYKSSSKDGVASSWPEIKILI